MVRYGQMARAGGFRNPPNPPVTPPLDVMVQLCGKFTTLEKPQLGNKLYHIK